jgi:hypothetical protein
MLPKLASDLKSSCLSLLSGGIMACDTDLALKLMFKISIYLVVKSVSVDSKFRRE